MTDWSEIKVSSNLKVSIATQSLISSLCGLTDLLSSWLPSMLTWPTSWVHTSLNWTKFHDFSMTKLYHSMTEISFIVNRKYNIEGFQPEPYISNPYHCRDIPFWSETLNMQVINSFLHKVFYEADLTSLSTFYIKIPESLLHFGGAGGGGGRGGSIEFHDFYTTFHMQWKIPWLFQALKFTF